jgi:hypothetical protein
MSSVTTKKRKGPKSLYLIKDKFELRIAYNRATFFSRTDPFIEQARIALGLTDEQVDMILESSLV